MSERTEITSIFQILPATSITYRIYCIKKKTYIISSQALQVDFQNLKDQKIHHQHGIFRQIFKIQHYGLVSPDMPWVLISVRFPSKQIHQKLLCDVCSSGTTCTFFINRSFKVKKIEAPAAKHFQLIYNRMETKPRNRYFCCVLECIHFKRLDWSFRSVNWWRDPGKTTGHDMGPKQNTTPGCADTASAHLHCKQNIIVFLKQCHFFKNVWLSSTKFQMDISKTKFLDRFLCYSYPQWGG